MKNLFSLLVIITLFLISLFRGNGKDKSVVGITKCMPEDHVLFVFLILSGIVYAILAIWWMRKEQAHKTEIGYEFTKDEIKMDTKTLVKLNFMGFVAGFLHSGFGVGSGFTVNPTLVMLGLHPAPASATGMYIAMLNALAASIAVTLFGKMNLIYALLLCIFTAIGTFPGLILQHWLVAKTGRASITVLIIFTLVVFSAFCNPIIAAVNLSYRADEGKNIMETGSYC